MTLSRDARLRRQERELLLAPPEERDQTLRRWLRETGAEDAASACVELAPLLSIVPLARLPRLEGRCDLWRHVAPRPLPGRWHVPDPHCNPYGRPRGFDRACNLGEPGHGYELAWVPRAAAMELFDPSRDAAKILKLSGSAACRWCARRGLGARACLDRAAAKALAVLAGVETCRLQWHPA